MRRPRLLALVALALLVSSTLALSAQQATLSSPALQTIAVVGGQPDDITTDGSGRLVWGDLASGTIDRLERGRVAVIARGISVPEGIVTLSHGVILVAEQGRDRIVRIGQGGKETVIHSLQPVPGQEGVDGIGLDARSGALLVPDSPRGTVLSMSVQGRHPRVIARGLGRPVDAKAGANGTVFVPDEHLGTVVTIGRRGRVSHRGTFSTPDDVAIDRHGRVWVTSLGDGGLWVMDPGRAPRRVLSGLGNPQGLTLDSCGDPIVVEQQTARIVRLLLTGKATRCRL